MKFRRSIVHFPMSRSLKNEIGSGWSIVPCLMSSLLKNETKCPKHSSLSCVKLIKKWNKGYEDSSFTVSTSLKNETPPFPNRFFWLRSRKIQVESFINLESEPSFHPLCWMQWSLGGMYLDLRYYAGGMRTHNKHSFSFQACVNMKLNPSRVLHGSSLCKNEPISNSHLVIVVYLLNSVRWALVVFIPLPPSLWLIICFHLVVYPFLRNRSDECFC